MPEPEVKPIREIEFKDEHNFKLINVFEEALKDAETGLATDGSVKKTVIENKTIKEIREVQTHNLAMFEQFNGELKSLQAAPSKAPDALPARLQQLLKDIETVNEWRKAMNAHNAYLKKIDETKDHRKRAIKAIDMCNFIMEERRKKYPDASVEPIDTVQVE